MHDLTIENKKLSKSEKKEVKEAYPVYRNKLEIPEGEKARIIQEIIDEMEVIDQQRKDDRLEIIWSENEAAYNMEYLEEPNTQFQIYDPITREKVDYVTGDIVDALFGSDTIFSISPDPESSTDTEVAEKQEQFLDTQFDVKIPLKPEIELVARSAVVKGTGILKLYHEIDEVPRKREETYKGDPKIVQGPDGQPMMENKGLEEFQRAYQEDIQEAIEKEDKEKLRMFEAYSKKLAEGKTINLVVEYKDAVYNDPKPQYVALENFFVRTDTDGYKGLTKTRLIAEKRDYSYWELKQKEEENEFYDIDKMLPEKKGKFVEGYQKENYEIHECIFNFKLNKDDDEFTKAILWVDLKKKVIIGSILYPWYGIDCPYIPFYVKKTSPGFYQDAPVDTIIKINATLNALINFGLEGVWLSNTITPIIDPQSTTALQMFNNQWDHGIPMFRDRTDEQIDFVNNYLRPTDINSILAMYQQVSRKGDDVFGVSSLMSGRESISDPTAPASKTIALMQQSSKNVQRYITSMLPSFNKIGEIVLQMYYQISAEGRKFSPNKGRFANSSDPFITISRDEMIARTNIRSMAYAFDFDKINLKRELVALYQMFRQEPLIANNPIAVNNFLRMLFKAWSPMVKEDVDKLLMPPEQFQQQVQQMIAQTTVQYLQQKEQMGQEMGIQPEVSQEELMGVVGQNLEDMATPPSKEEMKAREEA